MYIAKHSYTELYTAIQGNTQLHRVIHSYTELYRAIQTYSQLYRVIHSYTELYKGTTTNDKNLLKIRNK